MIEKMQVQIESHSWNVSFARVVVAAFISRLDPTIEELEDVKTAVSEAVTNAVIHGYREEEGIVTISCEIEEETLTVTVSDQGVGIADVKQAMEPMYTGRPELERSGMGFSFMEAFMDVLSVESSPGQGTVVRMQKSFQKEIVRKVLCGKGELHG